MFNGTPITPPLAVLLAAALLAVPSAAAPAAAAPAIADLNVRWSSKHDNAHNAVVHANTE
nr:hypothetical protein [Thermoleophilaceae bacterium]